MERLQSGYFHRFCTVREAVREHVHVYMEDGVFALQTSSWLCICYSWLAHSMWVVYVNCLYSEQEAAPLKISLAPAASRSSLVYYLFLACRFIGMWLR